MNIGRELAAFVLVAEEIAYDGEDRAKDLNGDVPARTHNLVREPISSYAKLMAWNCFDVPQVPYR